MSLPGVLTSGLRWTAPVQNIPPTRSYIVPSQPAVLVPHANTVSSSWASVLLRDSKTLLCTGLFFFLTSTWTIDRLCVICLSRRIHWMLNEPQVESFVSREICECSLCHLLACRELVQHWIGGFAERGVFHSAEDYNEHTGRLPQRFRKPNAWLVQCLEKKNVIKNVWVFVSFIGWPLFLSLEKKKKDGSFYWMQNWLSMFVKQSCALKPNSLMWTSLTLLIIWPSKSKALWLCSSVEGRFRHIW